MNFDISTRIERVITDLQLKKVEFASRLKIDQSYVTQLTTGRRNPSERLISDICREFSVNETWLRTGEGEMFVQKTRAQEIDEFISDILKGEPDFRQQLVSLLARMTPEEWKMLERKAIELVDAMKKTSNIDGQEKTSPASTEDAEEAYRKSSGYAPNRALSASNTSGGTERNTDTKAV